MKFSVGYQMQDGDSFLSAIEKAAKDIYEVYFSYGDFANGRTKVTDLPYSPEEAQARQESDLSYLHDAGLSFNLLLNANCYGGETLARSFYEKIGDTVWTLAENIRLTSVTTTSPLIAKFIKENFPELKTRASVNMSIGEISGMDYVADVFDGFYMKREHNRNMAKIRELSAWCKENDKELFCLANSGCLNHCSAHTFHDNLVAHETEAMQMDNAYSFRGVCQVYLGNPEKQVSVIRDTNFIRPEDLSAYEGYFTAAKLATRVNPRPEQILKAYTEGTFSGNTLQLLEPDHSGTLYPYFIDNKRFPDNFLQTVTNCKKDCRTCNYCENVFRQAAVDLSRLGE